MKYNKTRYAYRLIFNWETAEMHIVVKNMKHKIVINFAPKPCRFDWRMYAWSQKDKYGKDTWWLSISFNIFLIIAQEEEWKANEIHAKFGDVLIENFTEVMKYTIHRFKMPVNSHRINNKKSPLKYIKVA